MTFHKEIPPVGARPGTLAIPEGSPPPEIHVVEYDVEGARFAQLADVEEAARYVDPDKTTWVDVRGLGDEAVLRRIGEIFGLHALTLEDAVNVPQRAKSEIRLDQQVVIARVPIAAEEGRLEVPQVCFVIGRSVLLTFQERFFGFFEPVRTRIRDGIGRPIRRSGPDYLAYALIDTLVDSYFPIAEDISQHLDELEEEILDDPQPEQLAALHRIRRQLAVLRRIGWPQREAINNMVREHSPFLSDEVRSYLRDTDGHIAQLMELVDSSREMSVGLTDLYLSSLGQRTNDIMKVLTLMASIFIPLTFVAGIYGMNFENMPELSARIGYPLVLLTMLAIAGGMIAFFRRRGWMGGRRKR